MYFITGICIDKDGIVRSRWRTFGYFTDYPDALRAVKKNTGDMHECLYNYLFIESINPNRIFPESQPMAWFKWNKTTGKWNKTKVKKAGDVLDVFSCSNWAVG